MSEITQGIVASVERELLPLAGEGGRATFMGVPVAQLSREALLGLVGHLGREQAKREERSEGERQMWLDLVRARRRG